MLQSISSWDFFLIWAGVGVFVYFTCIRELKRQVKINDEFLSRIRALERAIGPRLPSR
jgi:hypothetical protein